MNIDSFFDLIPFVRRKKQEAHDKMQRAEIQAKELLLTAKEEALKIEKAAEEEARRITKEVVNLEKRLRLKESEVEAVRRRVEEGGRRLEQEKKSIAAKRDEVLTKVQKIAQLTQEEAKDLILRGWEEKLKKEITARIKSEEEKLKNTIDEKAKEMLTDAMRYGAVDYVAEYTLSVVSLPNEELKGRIIGKEGRNIRAFELASGVDVDLEEEGTIKLSSFDAVRREIARIALERLIRDGRIQPERIEEVIRRTKEEIEKTIVKAGQELCEKVGVFDLPFEVVKFLGRFKYRY